MWAEYVKTRHKPLLPEPFDLQFRELIVLNSNVGINESDWQEVSEADGFDAGGLW